jgi:hypothetical protein
MKKTLFIFITVLALGACNKQIDDIRPLNKIDKDGELSSVAGVVETTVGNYVLLSASGFAVYDEPYENIGESRGNNVTLQEFGAINQQSDAYFFQNSNGPTLGFSANYYHGAYQLIVSANTTLEGISTFEASGLGSLSEDDKNSLLYAKGENMFLRAMTYFNLVRIYGKPYYQNAESSSGVPLKTSSDITDVPPVATVKEVYDFVVSELKTAAQLMKAPVTKANSFASTGAAWALLSRVYLYMGGSIASPDVTFNQQAVVYADSALDQSGGKYTLLQGADYQNFFADDEFGDLGRALFANNKEIIFAFDNASGGCNIGELYHFDQTYNVGAVFVPSSEFKSLLDPSDVRSTFFKLNANSGFTETTKWLVLPEAWLTRAPTIYLRTGEIYLNRAEAYAKLNNMAMAKADLKQIHTRAGLPAGDIDGLADGDVIAAILKERRMELAFEGHGSFDYFRNGLPMTRLAADNNGNAFTIQPDDPKVAFTVPNN